MQSDNEGLRFADLPDELLLRILQLLRAEDLVCVARLGRTWRALADDVSLWRLQFERRYASECASRASAAAAGDNWKQRYKFMEGVRKNWRVGRGRQTAICSFAGVVRGLQFEGDRLAAAHDRNFSIISLTHPSVVTCVVTSIRAHGCPVGHLRYSAGRVATTGAEDVTAKLWDPQCDRPLMTFEHPAPVACLEYAPGESCLISGSKSTCYVWDVRSGTAGLTLPQSMPVTDVQLLADGRLFTVTRTGVLGWDLRSGRLLPWSMMRVERVSLLRHFGSTLAVGTARGRVLLYDAKTMRLIGDLTLRDAQGQQYDCGPVRAMQFDAEKLLSAGRDHSIYVWDLVNGSNRLLYRLPGYTNFLTDLQFDDTQLISTGTGNTVMRVSFAG